MSPRSVPGRRCFPDSPPWASPGACGRSSGYESSGLGLPNRTLPRAPERRWLRQWRRTSTFERKTVASDGRRHRSDRFRYLFRRPARRSDCMPWCRSTLTAADSADRSAFRADFDLAPKRLFEVLPLGRASIGHSSRAYELHLEGSLLLGGALGLPSCVGDESPLQGGRSRALPSQCAAPQAPEHLVRAHRRAVALHEDSSVNLENQGSISTKRGALGFGLCLGAGALGPGLRPAGGCPRNHAFASMPEHVGAGWILGASHPRSELPPRRRDAEVSVHSSDGASWSSGRCSRVAPGFCAGARRRGLDRGRVPSSLAVARVPEHSGLGFNRGCALGPVPYFCAGARRYVCDRGAVPVEHALFRCRSTSERARLQAVCPADLGAVPLESRPRSGAGARRRGPGLGGGVP